MSYTYPSVDHDVDGVEQVPGAGVTPSPSTCAGAASATTPSESTSDTAMDIVFMAVIATFAALTIAKVCSDREACRKLKGFFTDPRWLAMLMGVLVVVIVVKASPLRRRGNWNKACNAALNGFIVAMFASIDFTIAPFWFIFILTVMYGEM